MRNLAWIALLRHIPPEQHSRFSIFTRAGTEISIQNFLRIDHEVLMIRGRLAASQDQGRVFFIPYDEIDYLATTESIQEAEFNELFETLEMPSPLMDEMIQPPPLAPPMPPGPASMPPGRPPGVPGSGSGPRPAIRSEVLERYRNIRSGGRPGSGNVPRPPES